MRGDAAGAGALTADRKKAEALCEQACSTAEDAEPSGERHMPLPGLFVGVDFLATAAEFEMKGKLPRRREARERRQGGRRKKKE